jgi:hypothetical protein
MKTLTLTEAATTPAPGRDEKCAVVVLYEGTIAHDKAMEVCERLSQEVGGDVVFEFTCWRFARLADPLFAGQAHEAAARADVILFATHGGDLPEELSEWLTRCAIRIHRSEAAISVLFVEPISPSSSIGPVLSQLEGTAQRLRMDFLPLIPLQTRQAIETVERRERTVASLLSGARPQQHSSHYGLND